MRKTASPRPFAGMTRIRFKGCFSVPEPLLPGAHCFDVAGLPAAFQSCASHEPSNKVDRRDAPRN